jgi:translation initiation factor IF-1
VSRDAVLALSGVVSQELSSDRYRVRTDDGGEVLAYVPLASGIATAVRPGDRVHMALGLEDTAPARILGILDPATSPGR